MIYKCDKTYKKKNYLQQHIKLKHSKVEPLQCLKCDKHFVNKYSLGNHVRLVHPSKLLTCTFCRSSFKASIIGMK